METGYLDSRVKRTFDLEAYQVEALKILTKKTRVRQVDFVREALDDLILKYQKELPQDLTKKVKEKSQRVTI